jgi:opacity protein-like surface antigen
MNMRLALTLSIVLLSLRSFALYTEIGVNYAYKKSFIDSTNSSEQQGTTGSISLYFWEQVALEISYTNSLYVKKELNAASPSTSIRTTTQIADVYGADLIYVFADRKAAWQPYIKGGVAYVNKRQSTQIDNNPPFPAGPYTGSAPSYGVGLKFFLTDALAIRSGYDVVNTPIDNSSYAQDINGRIGLSWIF